MTRTTKAKALGVAATLMITAGVAAQPNERGGHRSFGPVRYLNLTDEQKDAFRQIREQQRPQMEALHEQMRSNHDLLQKALESASPDPAAVGRLAIQGHKLREKGRVLRDEADKQLRALLTPDQQSKFDALRALRKERDGMGGPGGPGARGWHHGGPPAGMPDEPPPPDEE